MASSIPASAIASSPRRRSAASVIPRTSRRRCTSSPARPMSPGRSSPSMAGARFLFDGDGVDDRLHRAGDARGPEREEKLPGLVLYQLLGVHVLEDVDAVHRQQDLVHLENAG